MSKRNSSRVVIEVLAADIARRYPNATELLSNIPAMLDAGESGLAVVFLRTAIDELDSVDTDVLERVKA